MQQRWYEKLHDWENALRAYEKKYEQDPDDTDLLLGRMRCMEALGEWYGHSFVNSLAFLLKIDLTVGNKKSLLLTIISIPSDSYAVK